MPLLQTSGGLLINMVLAKPEPQNAQATEITCQFTNSLGADMTDLLFQASGQVDDQFCQSKHSLFSRPVRVGSGDRL